MELAPTQAGSGGGVNEEVTQIGIRNSDKNKLNLVNNLNEEELRRKEGREEARPQGRLLARTESKL
ncbi:hypothetical protein CC1G_13555 [Coprinopsis cinerea okayama7|uniref:Uncharacterized protein n=1 Tax=Coprinopsis cinerea (strain Okayama-7 / 130 / ATCC MYA-4618 / FGSC 9003) TaxID=240176 RepID=D6RK24_COPC7|nr:hypothetical protein CC1G_13555 [Coprinopsis cinerea okayama7\|eukprot:XP_002912027.1 hypothetical protein CC1G_13555 [Coprinopsis cinerea okayama7\